MHMPDSAFTPAVQAATAQDLSGSTADIGDLNSWMNLGQAASFGGSSQNILPDLQMPFQDELSLDLDAEAWAHLAGLI